VRAPSVKPVLVASNPVLAAMLFASLALISNHLESVHEGLHREEEELVLQKDFLIQHREELLLIRSHSGRMLWTKMIKEAEERVSDLQESVMDYKVLIERHTDEFQEKLVQILQQRKR